MFKRNSWLSRCITPKTGLPVSVIWSASGLAWVLLVGLWAGLSYGGVVPGMFLPTPGAVVEAAVRLAVTARSASMSGPASKW
jgi:NitT/TauT family transport system permease protein